MSEGDGGGDRGHSLSVKEVTDEARVIWTDEARVIWTGECSGRPARGSRVGGGEEVLKASSDELVSGGPVSLVWRVTGFGCLCRTCTEGTAAGAEMVRSSFFFARIGCAHSALSCASSGSSGRMCSCFLWSRTSARRSVRRWVEGCARTDEWKVSLVQLWTMTGGSNAACDLEQKGTYGSNLSGKARSIEPSKRNSSTMDLHGLAVSRIAPARRKRNVLMRLHHAPRSCAHVRETVEVRLVEGKIARDLREHPPEGEEGKVVLLVPSANVCAQGIICCILMRRRRA